MSTDSLTDDELDQLRKRDVRIRALDTALLVEQENRESKTLNLVMAKIEEDVADAMEEFADANPSDILAIAALQARVHRLVYLRRTIDFIRDRGITAAESLQANDINSTFNE
jgi:hypothetical protein